MPGPWEKYQAAGPWAKYSQPTPDPTDLSNVPGALPGMQTPQQAAGIQTPPLRGTSIDYGKVLGAGETAKGAAKGAAHTFLTISQGMNRMEDAVTPNALRPPTVPGQPTREQNAQYVGDLKARMQPTNTPQAVGYGGEQIGEYFIPGGAEEKAATKLAMMAPKLGKFAAPLARTTTKAISSGLVNKAQGGDFTTGALAGAGGGLFSEGLQAAAPIIAESALGVRAADRAAGRTPGQMILAETKGVNPGKIAQQAKAKSAGWTTELEQGAASSAIPVDLTPSRTIASDAQAAANLRNNPDTIRRVGQLSDLLNVEQGTVPNPMRTGAPVKSYAAIPPQVSASRALDLRRGTGELKGSWNPATPNDFADASVGRVYRSLNEGLNQAFPGAQALDRNISSMIPVAARAGATDLNASSLQRILGRFTRPTGALVGGTAGASYGYGKTHSILGALPYGVAGVVAPELIGSPTAQMIMARLASKGATPVVKAIMGGGLQAGRKKGLYENQ